MAWLFLSPLKPKAPWLQKKITAAQGGERHMLGHKKWSPLPGVSRLLHLSLWTMARLLGESLLIQVPAGKSRGGKIQEAVAGATLLLDSSHSTSLDPNLCKITGVEKRCPTGRRKGK